MQEFIEKVRKMRELQNRYFKGERDYMTLRACKAAEREVDYFLSNGSLPAKKQTPEASQPSLFS